MKYRPRDKMRMKTLHISERQYKWLKKKAHEMGITEAEIMRRALDKEIEKNGKY